MIKRKFRIMTNPKKNKIRQKRIKIASNPQNLANVDIVERFIDEGIREKRISDESVIKWLNTTFRKHLINVFPSRPIEKIPSSSPAWLVKAFESGELKEAVVTPKIREEYHHVLDFISSEKPKLGAALEVLAKVQAWDKRAQKKKEEFECRVRKYGSKATYAEMGELKFIHEFEDGFSIVELVDDKAKDWEGAIMGHCVGGETYEEEVIYSLRDKNMMPHATMQMRGKQIVQLQGKGNDHVAEKYHDYIIEFLQLGYKLDEEYLLKIGLIIINGKIIEISELKKYKNLRVGGNLNLSKTQIRELPEGLTVGGYLYLSGTRVKKIPTSAKIAGKVIGLA